MERRKAIEEIHDSEKAYIDSLMILMDKFGQNSELMIMMEYNVHKEFFADLNPIVEFHKEFYNAMRKSNNISKVFLDYSRFLLLYVTYFNSYQQKMDVLTKLENKPEYRRFMSHARDEGRGINSYLIMPIQRIPRYFLLLETIRKHTPEDHEEYPDLCKCIELVSQITNKINEKIRIYENMSSVFQMHADGFQLIQPGRHLLYRATNVAVKLSSTQPPRDEDKENNAIHKTVQRHPTMDLLLFSDLLAFGRGNKIFKAMRLSRATLHPSGDHRSKKTITNITSKIIDALFISQYRDGDCHNKILISPRTSFAAGPSGSLLCEMRKEVRRISVLSPLLKKHLEDDAVMHSLRQRFRNVKFITHSGHEGTYAKTFIETVRKFSSSPILVYCNYSKFIREIVQCGGYENPRTYSNIGITEKDDEPGDFFSMNFRSNRKVIEKIIRRHCFKIEGKCKREAKVVCWTIDLQSEDDHKHWTSVIEGRIKELVENESSRKTVRHARKKSRTLKKFQALFQSNGENELPDARPPITKEGWLSKAKTRSYKRYYCTLQNCCLLCYGDEEDFRHQKRSPVEMLNLETYKIQTSKYKHVPAIEFHHSYKRSHTFFADNEAETLSWKDAISENIALHKGPNSNSKTPSPPPDNPPEKKEKIYDKSAIVASEIEKILQRVSQNDSQKATVSEFLESLEELQ